MIRILLLPFSLLFGIITFVRNKLYDWKIIPSLQYDDIFVISIGNITVGGTGKTPFVEYLLRMLSQYCLGVAVLSHGYKRTTKGFRFVDGNLTPCETGDESYQIKRKFPEIVVAVDDNKVNGIAQIRNAFPDIKIILLDDAFQYRRIRPNMSILLTDFNRPMFRDSMLPGGRLREWSCFAKRADIMVITKSPANITTDEQQKIKQHYDSIFPSEPFFTTIGYGEPQAMFKNTKPLSTADIKQYDVLLVTGIANPKPFEAYIRQHAASVQTIAFPDHHSFTEKNVKSISKKMLSNETPNPKPQTQILITTEKDAVRLQQMKIPEALAKYSYYVPIEVKFVTKPVQQFWDSIYIRARELSLQGFQECRHHLSHTLLEV